MSNQHTYLLLSLKGTQEQRVIDQALSHDKDERLFVVRATLREAFSDAPDEPASDSPLLLDLQANLHNDVIDYLRQAAADSKLEIRASMIDTELADINSAAALMLKQQNDHSPSNQLSSEHQSLSSLCAFLDRRCHCQLIKEQEASKEDVQNLKTLIEMLRDGILVVDRDGMVHYANPATLELFHRTADQLIGYPFGYPIADDENTEISLLRPDGTECIVEMRAIPITWNSEYAVLASLRDVTEHKHLQRELENLATHDGLTNLYNHRMFNKMINDEIKRSQRYNQPLSLLMLDIDHFKQVNDSYGHLTGDMILRKLGEMLMEEARNIDRVCRYGGEEIMVILPETEAHHAVEVAERLRQTVESKWFPISEDDKIAITVSIGVGSFPLHAQTESELITAADTALYAAKGNGRNRVFLAALNG